MMNIRWIRRIALGLGVLVALLVVAGAIFTATFDVDRFTPEIVAAVKERTGRTLRFDGDLGLALFPRLAVRLPATTLSEPRGDAVFARLKSGSATLALLPLLRKQVAIDTVRIDGLQATIVRSKDGRLSIDDLLGTNSKPAASDQKSPAPTASEVSIGRIELRNADVTYRDVAAGRIVRLSELDLSAGRIAPSARSPIDVSGVVTSDAPAIKARVDASGELEWSDSRTLRGVHDVEITVDGAFNDRPLSLQASADRVAADNAAIDVRGLKASGHFTSASGAPIDARLVAPRLDVGGAKASGERIELTVKRGGSDAFDATVQIDGIRGDSTRVEATAVKLASTMRSGPRSTRVDAMSALTASVPDRIVRIERASGEAVIEDPAFGKPLKLPFTAGAAVDASRETVALQLQTRADPIVIANATVNVTGFSAPRVAFDVDAEQLDLDRLLPPSSPSASGQAAAKAAPSSGKAAPPDKAADEPIDWTALRTLQATGKLRVGRMRARGTDIADLRAAVKSAGGRVEVAPISLRTHGGSINGRVTLDSPAQRAATSGSLAGVQLRRVVGNIGGRLAVEGQANGTFDLASTGATVAQLKRALGGNLAVDVRDGALVGIDLTDLIGSAAGFLQSRGKQTGALDENKRTPFSQLSASVRIAGGVATNDDLKARSAQLDISGGGKLDVVTTELDYALRAQVLSTPATASGPLRSLAGVTVPVRLSGTLQQPAYAVDWTAVAADALLRRAAGRAGAPASSVLQGLGELLGRRKK